LERELGEAGSLRSRVFSRYRDLLRARAASPAFHPHGFQEVLDCGDAIFALLRRGPGGRGAAVCLHNVSATTQPVWRPARLPASTRLPEALQPYQTLWINLS
jgi:sucrose phosphorylase